MASWCNRNKFPTPQWSMQPSPWAHLAFFSSPSLCCPDSRLKAACPALGFRGALVLWMPSWGEGQGGWCYSADLLVQYSFSPRLATSSWWHVSQFIADICLIICLTSTPVTKLASPDERGDGFVGNAQGVGWREAGRNIPRSPLTSGPPTF